MSVAGTTAITELWAKCKAWFGRSLGSSTTATTVSIQLKNNAGDNLGSAASIAGATSTAAGAMVADDKSKLDGIEAGANNYTHPTTTAAAAAAKKVGKDAQGHVVLGDALTASDVGAAASSHSHDAATTSEAGFMSSADKTKLDGVATGAEVNQNAFSNVKVGSSTIAADSKTDTLELVAGDNVSLTPDTTNDKVTFGVTIPTISVAKGGTGATDASGARTNLDVYSKSEVDGLITTGAAFQGTVSAQSTISGSSYKAGWYWVVGTAGTYVGQTCEVGDMIYAIASKGASYSASDFTVVQNNLVEMTAAEVDAICV